METLGYLSVIETRRLRLELPGCFRGGSGNGDITFLNNFVEVCNELRPGRILHLFRILISYSVVETPGGASKLKVPLRHLKAKNGGAVL